MKNREIIKKGFGIFKENSSKLLVISFIISSIATVFFIASTFLVELSILLVIFGFTPLLVSLAYISYKLGENQEVEINEIYFGYKNYLPSVIIYFNKMFKALLWTLLFGIVCLIVTSIISVFILQYLYPQIFNDYFTAVMNGGDLTQLSQLFQESLLKEPGAEKILLFSSYGSLLITGLFYYFYSIKSSYTLYIGFSMPLVPNAQVGLSYKAVKEVYGKYFLLHSFYLLLALLPALIAVGAYFGLNYIVSTVPAMMYGIILFIILLMPIIVFAHITNYQFYKEHNSKVIQESLTQYKDFLDKVGKE